MANQQEIEAMYDWVDYFHELRLGKWADFTCAFFDGNFKKTLNQAQKDKHDWVLKGVGVNKPGTRILDIGCGWGPMLNAMKERGGTGVGLTLSSAQAKYCKKTGLDTKVLDWKDVDPQTIGTFDAVVSIGAFEHFCSIEGYNAGKQREIYEKFFDLCADVLPVGGKLYLQTMIWGKEVPEPKKLRLDAPEGTPERILARLCKFYPGSWLPKSKDQIVKIASKRFKLLKSSNGRKDYIETQKRWNESNKILWTFPTIFKSVPAIMRLLPRYCFDKDFRTQIESVFRYDTLKCLTDEIITHERMFFERIK